MSFDDHDRCRRCGADDTASHTTAECERIRRERAEAQRRHDATHGAARCGFGKACGWMLAALDDGAAHNAPAVNVRFARREYTDRVTLQPFKRVVMLAGSQAPALVRACPHCGGDPNAEEPATR